MEVTYERGKIMLMMPRLFKSKFDQPCDSLVTVYNYNDLRVSTQEGDLHFTNETWQVDVDKYGRSFPTVYFSMDLHKNKLIGVASSTIKPTDLD